MNQKLDNVGQENIPEAKGWDDEDPYSHEHMREDYEAISDMLETATDAAILVHVVYSFAVGIQDTNDIPEACKFALQEHELI